MYSELKHLESEGRYEDLLKLSIKLLKDGDNIIDDELMLYEYIILTGLEYGQFDWAKYGIECLYNKVSKDSRRIKRFEMKMTNNVNEILTQGAVLLSSQTHDLKTRKTILSTFKDDGNTLLYIDLLNFHLNDYPTDHETWHELSEIYIQQYCYSYAIYCVEECLLYKNRNLYNFVTLAELYSSINENIVSLKYFSFVVLLNKNFLRALWGILVTSLQSNGGELNITKKLKGAIARKLVDVYSTNNTILSSICLKLLHKLESL